MVILTKADLVEDYSEQMRAAQKVAVGIGVYAISAKTGFGLDLLEDYLKPGCAVMVAIESGELSKERWESYLKLKREARFSDDKEEYLHQKQQWHKDLAKWSKQIKKSGRYRK
ncbi:MAG: hypothetical protein ACOX6S_10565 [Clostridia bacterium]